MDCCCYYDYYYRLTACTTYCLQQALKINTAAVAILIGSAYACPYCETERAGAFNTAHAFIATIILPRELIRIG